MPIFLLLVACHQGISLDGDGVSTADVEQLDQQAECGGPCIVPEQGVFAAYHRLEIDEDGVAWVSWVEVQVGAAPVMYLARSARPGALFEPSVRVPTAEPPIVGGSEKPALAAQRGALMVAYTGLGEYRHGDALAIYRQHARIDGPAVTFDDAVLVEESPGGAWVMEQPQLAMAPDGVAWLLYKRQQYATRDVAVWASSATDFVSVPVSDGLSTGHECSPPHLRVDGDGRPVAALRSNVDGFLETAVVVGEAADPVYLTDSAWAYTDAVCPEDGPRLAIDEETWAGVWVAPTDDGAVWRSHFAASHDSGRTWTVPVESHEDVGLGERWPTITAAGGGRFITTSERLDRSTRWFDRSSVDAVPVARELQAPGGGSVEDAEVAHGGNRTAALARSEAGRLVLIELK